MAGEVAFEAVVPIVPAGPDMAVALAFYVEKLGFSATVTGDPPTSAAVRRGAALVLLQRSDDVYWASQTTVRFRVSDVDALYAEVRAKGVEKITGIMVQPWGTREFHVIEPFGVCLHFYELLPVADGTGGASG